MSIGAKPNKTSSNWGNSGNFGSSISSNHSHGRPGSTNVKRSVKSKTSTKGSTRVTEAGKSFGANSGVSQSSGQYEEEYKHSKKSTSGDMRKSQKRASIDFYGQSMVEDEQMG